MQMQYDFVTLVRNSTGNSPSSRSLSLSLGATFDELNQYGCWCYFEQDHGMGHGQTLDDFDSLCKVLANGYDCIKLDVGASCIPWEVNYNSGQSGGLENLPTTCANNNPGDDCKINSCIVEGRFVLNLFQQIVMNQAQLDQSMKTSNGFIQEQVCAFGTGETEGPVQCCGEYPQRFKFRTNAGAMACCGREVFPTAMMECCANGSAELIGDCP
jgi:hypothetical protein